MQKATGTEAKYCFVASLKFPIFVGSKKHPADKKWDAAPLTEDCGRHGGEPVCPACPPLPKTVSTALSGRLKLRNTLFFQKHDDL